MARALTGADYLRTRLQDLIAQADEVATGEFDAEEMARFARDAAAMFERFLKRIQLRQPPNVATLYNLINALQHEGVDEADRDRLHALRRAANAGKHDPEAILSHGDVVDLLSVAQLAVRGLARAGVPGVLDRHVPQYRRRFLIAIWDHFAIGESELYVWPVLSVGSAAGQFTPQPMDEFQFEYRDEDRALSLLESAGDLRWADVDESTREVLNSAGDFARAGFWEGEYRDLVAACGSAQHSLDLLPGLARADQQRSVSIALAMTMVDLLGSREEDPSAISDEDLLTHAASVYGISRRSHVTARLGSAYAAFVQGIAQQYGGALQGPRLVSRDLFAAESESAVRVDTDLGLALTTNGTLLFEIG